MSDATPKRSIAKADLLPYAEYAKIRVENRQRMAKLKQHRRVEVGPFATFYFENWQTIWHQIQEMLHIEKGGEAQMDDEIEAYAPLIPKGGELVATVMFEIDELVRRQTQLLRIGGIENHATMRIGGTVVRAEPDPTRENTSPEGKASSVQFFTFKLNPDQVRSFSVPNAEVFLGFDHPNYGHIAVVPEAVRAALTQDL
jgi:hypothetical protein